VGLENMTRFARVTVQGRLRRIDQEPERTRAIDAYLAKLPNAKVFMVRPGVDVYVLEPSHAVCARGLMDRFEVDFPAAPARA
jgi:hypothetical protein